MEIELPFDFVVSGAPLSLQASAESRAIWRERIQAAIQAKREGWEFQHTGPVAVSIGHFPGDELVADADNIAKPIVDAMKGILFADDKQVERILVRRFDPRGVVPLRSISAELQRALECEKPLIYVKVSFVPQEEDL